MPTESTVCHLVTNLDIGGTEHQLALLLGGLAKTRWRTELAVLRPPGPLVTDIRALGIEPHRVSLPSTLAHPAAFATVVELAIWLRRKRAVLLHCHDVYAVLVGVHAARLAGVPVIAARRDLGHQLRPLQRWLLGTALRRATRVLANSLAVAAQAERRDGVRAERLVVIPNAIDLAHFDRSASPPAPLVAGGGRTILTIGRMTHPAKGHDDLLAAAVRVCEVVPDVRFVLVGDGPRETALRRLADDLGLAGRVRFLSRRTDVPALLASADLVCHPARAEGMPNAVIEAMAGGRPIVATTAGGIPELIEDGVHGVLVPTERPTELAAALIALLADPKRALRLGAAARERAERRFSLEQLVGRIDALYGAMGSCRA